MKERVATGCSAVSAGATMTPHLIPLISAFIKSPRGVTLNRPGKNEWTTTGVGGQSASLIKAKQARSSAQPTNRWPGIFAEEIITARPLPP